MINSKEEGIENQINNENTDILNIDGSGLRNFSDRLKEIIGSNSIRGFAKKSNISEGIVRKYLKNETEPTLKNLLSISESNNVDLNWLATGKGNLLPIVNHDTLLKVNPQNFVIVPELNVKVAAGNGVCPLKEEQVGQFIFSKYWLSKEGLSNAKLSILHVVGDSMETTINDGDIVLVNVKEEGWTGALNGVFVILMNDLLMVKRIQYDMLKDGFHIKSDNPIYDPYFIKPDEGIMFKVVAKVERVLTKMRPIR